MGEWSQLMTPIERAAEYYERHMPVTLKDDIETHLLHGYVLSTPEAFAMGRAVRSTADPEDILNPVADTHVEFEEADCWHVHFFAGDLMSLWRFLPYPLPWASFARGAHGRGLRFYRLEDIQARMKRVLTRSRNV